MFFEANALKKISAGKDFLLFCSMDPLMPSCYKRGMFKLFCALTLFLSGIVWTARAEAQEKTRIAVSVRNVVLLPFYIAKDRRFFDRNALDVELIQMSDLQVAGLTSGGSRFRSRRGKRDSGDRQRFAAQSGRRLVSRVAFFSVEPSGPDHSKGIGR